MPGPGEFIVELLLLVVVGVVIVLIVRQFWGKNEVQLEHVIRSTTRPSFRRGIIMFAETVAVIQVILFTVLGAVLGGIYSGMTTSQLAGQDRLSADAFWAFLGGFAGFATSAIFMGIIFAIGAIEKNTRTTAILLGLLAKPRVPE